MQTAVLEAEIKEDFRAEEIKQLFLEASIGNTPLIRLRSVTKDLPENVEVWYSSGCDLDWYAIDSKGQIACFITSGFAFVPKLVFRDKEILWKTYNYFYDEPDYKALPASYSLMDYDTCLYSARGLYIFDNPSDESKPYELIKSPGIPVRLSDLPLEIMQFLQPLTFENLSFESVQEIDVRKYFDCI